MPRIIDENVKDIVTVLKISPNPSLPKRGISRPPLKKGDEGGFRNKNILSRTSKISYNL